MENQPLPMNSQVDARVSPTQQASAGEKEEELIAEEEEGEEVDEVDVVRVAESCIEGTISAHADDTADYTDVEAALGDMAALDRLLGAADTTTGMIRMLLGPDGLLLRVASYAQLSDILGSVYRTSRARRLEYHRQHEGRAFGEAFHGAGTSKVLLLYNDERKHQRAPQTVFAEDLAILINTYMDVSSWISGKHTDLLSISFSSGYAPDTIIAAHLYAVLYNLLTVVSVERYGRDVDAAKEDTCQHKRNSYCHGLAQECYKYAVEVVQTCED